MSYTDADANAEADADADVNADADAADATTHIRAHPSPLGHMKMSNWPKQSHVKVVLCNIMADLMTHIFIELILIHMWDNCIPFAVHTMITFTYFASFFWSTQSLKLFQIFFKESHPVSA